MPFRSKGDARTRGIPGAAYKTDSNCCVLIIFRKPCVFQENDFWPYFVGWLAMKVIIFKTDQRKNYNGCRLMPVERSETGRSGASRTFGIDEKEEIMKRVGRFSV